MRIPSGKTDQYIYFVALDSTDLVTRKTGLTGFTVYRSRNNGSATVYTTPTIAELSSANMPGLYALLVDEDTTIASGSDSEEYAVHITCSGMAPVTRTIELYRRDTTTGNTLGVSSGGKLTGIDTDVIDAASLKADAGTEIGTAVWASATRVLTAGTNIALAKGTGVTGFNDITAQDVWDKLTSALTTSGSIGKRLADDIDATISSRGTGTALDAAGVRSAIGLASANLDTQLSTIAGYIDTEVASILTAIGTITDLGNGATIGHNLADIFNNTPSVDTAAIADAVWDEALSGHSTSGTAGLALSTAASGSVDYNLIADAVWDEALSGHTTAGTAGKAVSDIDGHTDTEIATILSAIGTITDLGNGATIGHNLADIFNNTPSVDTASIADAVWDEALSGHATAGTAGKALSDIDGHTDTEIATIVSQTAASAIRTAVGLASANLDTQLSTIAGYIDTEVAAIKAKTDLIPASPASVSDIPSASSIRDAVFAQAIETGSESMNFLQEMRGLGAVLLAPSTKIGNVRTWRDLNDTKDRVVATVTDTSRSSPTLDLD